MKDIYISMNTQNILKFYGSRLDVKLDSSEFYDYEISKVQEDYNEDVLDLTVPITYTGLTIDTGLAYASCSRNTITLSEYDNSSNDPDYIYSGLSFTLDYDNFVGYFGSPYEFTILNNDIYTYTGITGETHYFKIVGFNNPLNTDITVLPGMDANPECTSGITENCPIFFSNGYFTNIFYYNPNDIQGFKYLTTIPSSQIVPIESGGTRYVNSGVAMNDTKLFVVDVGGNYLEYDYTISVDGCLSAEFIRSFRLFDNFTYSRNAGYGIAMYDDNTLLVQNSANSENTSGSTIYQCDLTTLELTQWLDIPFGGTATAIYYNQNNGQTIVPFYVPSGGFVVYLYNGTTNPQKIGEVVCSMPISGIVFTGTTAIGVNGSALRYVLDFDDSTQTLIEDSRGVPIKLYNLNNNQENVFSVFQNASCYNFDYSHLIPTEPTP
jgi:hypothetical protein